MSLHPSCRQNSAQGDLCDKMAFAMAGPRGPDAAKFLARDHRAPRALPSDLPCASFPSTWPSPFVAGPFLSAGWAEKFAFRFTDFLVSLWAIITKDRGTLCGNYWRLAFWLCRCKLACKTTFSAAFWAQVWAQRLHRPRGATLLLALLWAACLALFATISRFAVRATKPNLTAPSSFPLGLRGLTACAALLTFARQHSPARPLSEMAYV
jgi:hypothetical protein